MANVKYFHKQHALVLLKIFQTKKIESVQINFRGVNLFFGGISFISAFDSNFTR